MTLNIEARPYANVVQWGRRVDDMRNALRVDTRWLVILFDHLLHRR